jgi:hypothetical protein
MKISWLEMRTRACTFPEEWIRYGSIFLSAHAWAWAWAWKCSESFVAAPDKQLHWSYSIRTRQSIRVVMAANKVHRSLNPWSLPPIKELSFGFVLENFGIFHFFLKRWLRIVAKVVLLPAMGSAFLEIRCACQHHKINNVLPSSLCIEQRQRRQQPAPKLLTRHNKATTKCRHDYPMAATWCDKNSQPHAWMNPPAKQDHTPNERKSEHDINHLYDRLEY